MTEPDTMYQSLLAAWSPSLWHVLTRYHVSFSPQIPALSLSWLDQIQSTSLSSLPALSVSWLDHISHLDLILHVIMYHQASRPHQFQTHFQPNHHQGLSAVPPYKHHTHVLGPTKQALKLHYYSSAEKQQFGHHGNQIMELWLDGICVPSYILNSYTILLMIH